MNARVHHVVWIGALLASLGASFPAAYQPHFSVKLVALGILALLSAVRLITRSRLELPSNRSMTIGAVVLALGPLQSLIHPEPFIGMAVNTSMLVCAAIVVLDLMNVDQHARRLSLRALTVLAIVEATIAVSERFGFTDDPAVTATVGNAEFLATFLSIALLLALHDRALGRVRLVAACILFFGIPATSTPRRRLDQLTWHVIADDGDVSPCSPHTRRHRRRRRDSAKRQRSRVR